MGRCNRCEVCSRLVGASVGLWPSRGCMLLAWLDPLLGMTGSRMSLPTKEPATRNGWGSLSKQVSIFATYFSIDRTP